MRRARTTRTCEYGHAYQKSSDCPVCPQCEKLKSKGIFHLILPAPACRALEHAGITGLESLAMYTESQILSLHGMGPSSIPKLRKALSEARLSFAPEPETL